MGSKKVSFQPHQPGVYRDEPDRDDAASTSSAVLLDDIDDIDDEDLPSYSDSHPYTDESPSTADPAASNGETLVQPRPGESTYNPVPPELPFSTHNVDWTEVRTQFPNYSNEASRLYSMLQQQSSFPPCYFVQLVGTHTETVRQNNKETKNKVRDFWIKINITSLLGGREIECLPDNKRGYRGGRLPVLTPNLADVETHTDPLRSWCDLFVNNPAGVRSFTMKRQVTNHDTKKLEQLLRSAISETNYRGHLHISFPTTHNRLIVYTPGRINQWRTTTWICWMFYLTFLWIFSWPVLFFLTHKYEVVKVKYPYANVPAGQPGQRDCAVMTEAEWFNLWQEAIKRAAIGRMICEENCLDDDYRIATAKAVARGANQPPPEVPRTGNALADGALGVLSQGLRVAEAWNASRGWGADC